MVNSFQSLLLKVHWSFQCDPGMDDPMYINIIELFLETIVLATQWWCMSVFPALMWQAGESLSMF